MGKNNFKQTQIPGVENQQRSELNQKIEDQRIKMKLLLNKVIKINSVESMKNAIANLTLINGAIKSILEINEISHGVGNIILNRSRYATNEKVSARYIAIEKTKDLDGAVVLRKSEKVTLSVLFPPINWDENNSHDNLKKEIENELSENERHKLILEENIFDQSEINPSGEVNLNPFMKNARG